MDQPEIDTPSSERGVPTSASLTNRTSVRELVEAWQRVEAAVRLHFGGLLQAENVANAHFGLGDRTFVRIDATYEGHHGCNWDRPDDCITRMRRQVWRYIVERLELRRVMSAKEWEALSGQNGHLEKGELPEITEESVTAFVQKYAGDLPQLFKQKVAEAFNWLRPVQAWAGADLKTNQKNARLEIGPTIIKTRVVHAGIHAGTFAVDYDDKPKLQAPESVFLTLDGRGFATKTHYGELVDAIEASTTGTAETAYFRVKMHKCGTLHIRFKRLDLLADLNKIAGGNALRPAA